MRLTSRRPLAAATALVAATSLLVLSTSATAGPAGSAVISGRYLIALEGTQTADGFTADGTAASVQALLTSVGATVETDLTRQIGVLVVSSPESALISALLGSPLVDEVGAEWRWKGLPDATAVTPMAAGPAKGDAPEQTADPLEPLQWDMAQIHAPQAQLGGVSAVGTPASGALTRAPTSST